MPKIAANGIQIEYESFGRQSDPLVVLVSGLSEQMGGVAFPKVFCEDLASHGLRAVRFDHRDIGLSTHFRNAEHLANYTFVDMAEDVRGLIEALGAFGAHVVGISYGGFIARHLAVRYPTLVNSLVLAMTGAGAKPGSVMDDRFSSMSPKAREHLVSATRSARSYQAAVDTYVETCRSFNGPGFKFFESWVRSCAETVCLRDYDPAGVARQFNAATKSPPLLDAQAEISCPTIVMHGDADPIFGIDHGLEIARRIPGARFERIEGLGHEMPPEAWPEFFEAITSAVLDSGSLSAVAL